MLTNERLGKCLGCHQTESGMSSPPDCGARKYLHSALGAADSGHALFCEHRRTSVFPHSLYMQVLKQFKVGEGLGLRVYRYNHF